MSRRILIIDDDKNMVKRRARLLEERDYEVSCAFNGKEALRILKKDSRFDLLILDLDMPKMRGDELLERIKDDPKFLSLRVLVVTGMEEPHITKRGDAWEYNRHPITKARGLGPTRRGWDGRFRLVRKWHTMDWYTLELRRLVEPRGPKPLKAPDSLTDRRFLEAVEEMFLEPEEIDRARREDEPWRILIAEDDKTIRENIKERLEKNKTYEVLLAEDGQIALEILSKYPIDLIILDLEMPRTRGDEVLSVLGSNFILRDIPVILYTGIEDWDKPDDESLRKKVEKLGIIEVTYEKKKEGFISRIFKLDTASQLLYKVEGLLRERQKWGHGYPKRPLTFFRNKENHWMPGALEYYQPVDPCAHQYKNTKTFFCSYCLNEKPIKDDFKHACEYNQDRLFLSEKFSVTIIYPVLICPACVKELYEKNSNLGRYALRDREIKSKVGVGQEQLKKRIKKSSKVPMNQGIFKKVRSIIAEACFTIRASEIKPISDLKKDIFKDASFYNKFMEDIKMNLELEYDIEISDNDTGWFDTVGDIVDCVNEKLKEKKTRKNS